MDFDGFVLVTLSRPADTPALDAAEADRVQDGHLGFLASLHDQGVLIAAGPCGGPDETVRGFAILTGDLETTRELWRGDPAVSSGWLTASFQTWHVPAGMMISGPGKPPTSLAEARS